MVRFGVVGIALALALLPHGAMAADSTVGAPPVPPMPGTRIAPPPVMMRSAPPIMAAPAGPDRWASVPGGGGAYRAPGYGQALPRHWIAPAHFIADYREVGLPTPARGYGWSRYYDDVVLTDRWGRVYDWRAGDDLRGGREGRRHKRHRHERYDEPPIRPHWDMGYVPGPVAVPCDCEAPVAAKPVCREVETVRYVTEYVPVRAKAPPRGKYVPRTKYKPHIKEVPIA